MQPERYVCVHVGASTPAPLAALEFRRGGRLACRSQVADRVNRHGRRSRLDRRGRRAASERRREPGRTHRPRQPGGPLSGASLLICNDTGVSHLAEALRVPSVVLSTGNNPRAGPPEIRSGIMRRRVALISEHASPLAVLGGVDSGGQNVYVGKVASHLAELGYDVDVFTRRDNSHLPRVARRIQGCASSMCRPALPRRYARKTCSASWASSPRSFCKLAGETVRSTTCQLLHVGPGGCRCQGGAGYALRGDLPRPWPGAPALPS